jgi:hypothetical protein
VTEKVHPGAAALEQGERQKWKEPGEEEWAAQEQEQVRMENALVLSVEQLCLTNPESRVTLSNAPNAVKKW